MILFYFFSFLIFFIDWFFKFYSACNAILSAKSNSALLHLGGSTSKASLLLQEELSFRIRYFLYPADCTLNPAACCGWSLSHHFFWN